jgi:hypothetical protein
MTATYSAIPERAAHLAPLYLSDPSSLREDISVRIISKGLTIPSWIWSWGRTGLDTITTRAGWENQPQCKQYQWQCPLTPPWRW